MARTTTTTGEVGRHLRQLFDSGSAVGLGDGELLERFVVAGDDEPRRESAFEAIVARHGSTVLSVCRQVLGDDYAAEDAFQATFLVLVRRAHALRIRAGGSLGSWLHGVACRTAMKARVGAARRRAREHRVAQPEALAETAAATAERTDLGAVLHAEVVRLPARYREAIVLCYFEGRSHDEAAATLGCPVGTVRSRLSRARAMLRDRLIRRGLAPAVAAAAIESAARAEVPAPLFRAVLEIAVHGAPAAAVAGLADRVVAGLLAGHLRLAAAAGIGLVAMAVGLGLASYGASGSSGRPSRNPGLVRVASPIPPVPKSRRPDDPLPAHALARLGTIRFHSGSAVAQVLYTPDGKHLITVDSEHVIHVWDTTSGQIVRDIGDSAIEFWRIALSRDGKTLATADRSRLRLWDVDTGKETRRWHELSDKDDINRHFDKLTFSPDGRTLALADGFFRTSSGTYVWQVDLRETSGPSERRRRIRADWFWLHDLVFAPDGKTLATASHEIELDAQGKQRGPERGSVRLWDLATGNERQRFRVEGALVHSLAISPDSALLAASVTDGTVRFYDLVTGQERVTRWARKPAPVVDGIQVFPGEWRAMEVLAFSPDGSLLAGGTDSMRYHDGFSSAFSPAAIHLWDAASGRELRRMSGHQQLVGSLAFAPDGRTLASAGTEPTIGLWDVATGREAVEQLGHRSAIRALAVSPKDRTIFTGGDDGTIRQWDPATGRELATVARLDTPADSWVLGPDGKSLIVCDRFRLTYLLWSIPERRKVRDFSRDDRKSVHPVAWSPDGTTFAAEGRIWDVATGRVRTICRTPDGQGAIWFPLAYSSDGRTVTAVGHRESSAWDVATGKRVGAPVRFEKLHVRVSVLSPDGRILASGGIVDRGSLGEVDPPIRLYDLATGKEIATLRGPEMTTLCLAFSPDGRLVASGSGDRWSAGDHSLRVWDVATGRELRRFDGHRGAVNAVAFTPDGRSVVSGSEDGTALVWDVSDLAGR